MFLGALTIHSRFDDTINRAELLQLDIQGKLKPVERRLATLKKHLEQAGIYFKYKGKKPLTEAEKIRKSVYSILRQEQREQQIRPAGRRIWNANGQGGGIANIYYRRPVLDFQQTDKQEF